MVDTFFWLNDSLTAQSIITAVTVLPMENKIEDTSGGQSFVAFVIDGEPLYLLYFYLNVTLQFI